MKTDRLSRLLVAVTVTLWIAVAYAASNQFSGPNRDAEGQIVPTPKGDQCVEPIPDMRANHMKYLLHKRNETMYDGIRTKTHSLVECINCHATPSDDGKVARISDDRHFCASCHRSASVKLDCFECHADVPVEYFSLQAAEARVAVHAEARP